MKKSQLRNIIKESIKELMTEQSASISGSLCCQMSVRNCENSTSGGWHSGGAYYYQQNGTCPVKGDVIEIVGNANSAWGGNNIGFVMGVQQNGVTCPSGGSNTRTYQTLSATSTSCSKCCSWTTGFGGPSGACTLNCGSTSAGSCNPSAWSQYNNWTNSFTNTVNNLNPNNPNQPCQFLNNKIAQFTANLQGTGQGGYQNKQNCKLDFVNQLHTQNNC